MSTTLGRLRTRDGRSATLTGAGWQSGSRELAEYLNHAFPLDSWALTPGAGMPGAHLLHEAATDLGASSEYLLRQSETPPGVIM